MIEACKNRFEIGTVVTGVEIADFDPLVTL